MNIKLKDIEPFNIPPVENYIATKFMRHLSGNETFEFNGDTIPLSVMIFEINYQYPDYSYAYGLMLSIDIDTFYSLCNNLLDENMEPMLKNYGVGKIKIEFGGNLDDVKITANSLSL